MQRLGGSLRSRMRSRSSPHSCWPWSRPSALVPLDPGRSHGASRSCSPARRSSASTTATRSCGAGRRSRSSQSSSSMATMCALVAWLTGRRARRGPPRPPRDPLPLAWTSAVPLHSPRAVARALSLQLPPPERCLFIGDADAQRCSASSSPTAAAPRRTRRPHRPRHDRRVVERRQQPPKLATIRETRSEPSVHRAIVAPASAGADDVLDLLRTLNAIGVPGQPPSACLEVVGSLGRVRRPPRRYS